jgi:phosphomannomutase
MFMGQNQRYNRNLQLLKGFIMASHAFNSTILREYDIRGEVGKTLFEADALALGKKFGVYLRQSGKSTICIGRDGRLTSPVLTASLINGLLWAGLNVTDLGIGPTPMLYYGLKTLKTDAGIMVTGSHNPAPDNGFKIVLQDRPFFGTDIQNVAKVDETIELVSSQGNRTSQDLRQDYVNRILQDYIPKGRRLKIVWDAGHGATADILKGLTQGIQADHILLNDEIDGTFPAHHPDPTVAENLTQLIDTVKSEEADVGIAFDGDGDRIGVVDGQGGILWGDQLLLLLARDMVTHNPGATIVADIKSSQALFNEIKGIGGNILMCRTGHSLIKKMMMETGALLAGEMSGHIFFADKYYGYDDALYSAVRFINILQQTPEPLDQMIAALPHFYNTPEIRIECSDERKFKVVEDICHQLKTEGATILTVDGVRVSRPEGWWLLRASNTQAALVARCEASTAEGLETLKQELSKYLSAYGLEF